MKSTKFAGRKRTYTIRLSEETINNFRWYTDHYSEVYEKLIEEHILSFILASAIEDRVKELKKYSGGVSNEE